MTPRAVYINTIPHLHIKHRRTNIFDIFAGGNVLDFIDDINGITLLLCDMLRYHMYTALQKFGITWSTGGMPEYWYPLWNTYCPW